MLCRQSVSGEEEFTGFRRLRGQHAWLGGLSVGKVVGQVSEVGSPYANMASSLTSPLGQLPLPNSLSPSQPQPPLHPGPLRGLRRLHRAPIGITAYPHINAYKP